MFLSEKRIKKRVFALFFCLVLSSCSSSQPAWRLTSNRGNNSSFSSSRLLFSNSNFSELEIDILQTDQGKVTYINACGIKLEGEGKSPEGYATIKITINIENHSYDYCGFLLQGGHRILLPEDASNLVVAALHENQAVEVSVAHYSTTILPDNFVENYQKLTY